MIASPFPGAGRRAAVVMVVAALAACGTGADTDGRVATSDQTTNPSTPDKTPVDVVVEQAELFEPVAGAVSDMFDTRPGAPVATIAYQDLSAAVGSVLASGADPNSVMASLDAALLASYEGPESAIRAAAVGDALRGRPSDLTFVDPKRGLTSSGTDDLRLKVYFVNGVNNTLEFARGTSAQLVQSLRHDVTHYYNPSAFDPDDYTQDWCARSIEALVAEQHQSALLTRLQADAEAADAIAAAADEGTLTWFSEAVRQSLAGVARDVDAVVGDAELTVAERALALACGQVDEVKNILQEEVAPGAFLLEWLSNSYEVASDRIDAALDISWNADDDLVELIKTDIVQGRRVLVVAHSHGTMMTRFVLQEINRWYTSDVLGPCPDGETPDPANVAPIAALYVSPGFTVDDDSQQRGIMVDGDFLSVVGQAANVPASGSQLDAGPIDRHDLRRYLEPGTATLAHIQGAYAELADHLAAVPDPAAACNPGVDEADDADEVDDGNEPAGQPTWKLTETVVNENGSEPHPYWTDLEVSPGHVAWVFDDGDPTFGAVYDVVYDPPPTELQPGTSYEIPVSVSGAVVTGNSQRFTAAEVILYINRGWDGAVRLEQNCVDRPDGLQCDAPAAVAGTLGFTAPDSGDTFEFDVDVLNCSACEVTFRYQLR